SGAPHARANWRRVGPAHAGRNDRPRSLPLNTWSLAAAVFAGAIFLLGVTELHSVLHEMSPARGCSRSQGQGADNDPPKHNFSAAGTSRAMGNSSTPYAALPPHVSSFLQWDRSRFREVQQLICR